MTRKWKAREAYDSFGGKRNKFFFPLVGMESVQRGATVLPTDSRLAAEHQGETSDRL